MLNLDKQKAVLIVVLLAVSSLAVTPVFYEQPIRDPWQSTDMDIQVNVSVKNLGNNPAETIPVRLGLPMDNIDQELLSSQFSVQPERFSNDSLGNSFVHFTIPDLQPGEEFLIQMNLSVQQYSVDYRVSKEDVGSSTEGMEEWLMPSQYINSDEESIKTLANEIANNSSWAYDIAWNTYQWIIDNIPYQQVAGEADATTTLRNGEGGSAELGNLFVALMRANHIPARRISGWGAGFDAGEEFRINRFAHGWAEFYLPDVGWLTVDPTWGKSSTFDNFAKSDDKHIVMTQGAGVKFLWRGAYSSPYGETEVDTDYTLYIQNEVETNLSPLRTILSATLYIVPLVFIISVFVRVRMQRVEVNVDLTNPPDFDS